MKVLRRLVRNGSSTHVSIPPRVMDFLRWRLGDPLVVEVTERMTLEIRPPRIDDLRTPGQPMVLDARLPEVKA